MQKLGTFMISLGLALTLIQCGGGDKTEAAKAPVADAVKSSTAETKAVGADTQTAYEYSLENGEAIYKKYCFACHDNGLAGAARHTDSQRWAESAAKGIPTLVKHVTEGYQGKYGMLPPKGTCMECSDNDIIDAVHYQLKMGGSLK